MAAKPEDENHDYDFDGDNDDNSDDDNDDDNDNDDDGDDHDDDNDHDDNDDLVWKFHAWAPLKQAGHSSDDCALLPQGFRRSTEENCVKRMSEIKSVHKSLDQHSTQH